MLETSVTIILPYRKTTTFGVTAKKDDHTKDEAADPDYQHAHEGYDPHAWLDPGNGKVWPDQIAAVLSDLNPENQINYVATAVEGKAEIDQVVCDIEVVLASIWEKPFIVFHDAYQYFEIYFNLPAVGAISLSDGHDPSPARFAEIRKATQKTD